MLSGALFNVFEKYKSVTGHAFSAGLVTETDKDAYEEIFSSIRSAAQKAIQSGDFSRWFKSLSTRFSRSGGVQGQRPVDLWTSVINVESENLGRYPQIYLIASGAGLEIGFAVSIHESDYYNANIKQQNRTIIPILYGKLPNHNSDFVANLDSELSKHGNWQFGLKTRQGSTGNFNSLSELIKFLKSPESSIQGGGCIYRTIEAKEFDAPGFDLDAAFSEVVARFAPLMRMLVFRPEENLKRKSRRRQHLWWLPQAPAIAYGFSRLTQSFSISMEH